MKTALLALVLLAPVGAPQAGAESSWPFWDHYAARFLNSAGRVIDPDRNSMTTSEGQSYAMFFALVADDRLSFDRLFAWTQNNLAQGNLAANLPAWSWGRDSHGEWGVLDQNSASDADLWMAYSLIEAGGLWNRPRYSKTGQSLLQLIAKQEVTDVPPFGPVLLPGKNGFHPAPDEWILNLSYMPLPLLLAADHFDSSGPWKRMSSELPNLTQKFSPAGFAMDWAKCGPGGLFPADEPGSSTKAARGGYDAIRVYLWAGMSAKGSPGAEQLLEIFAPMSRFVELHLSPPEEVAPDGSVLSGSAPAGFVAAVIPLLWSSGDHATAAKLRQTVTAQISPSSGLMGSPARYYDQNLALFGLGWQEKRFAFAPDGTLRVRWKY